MYLKKVIFKVFKISYFQGIKKYISRYFREKLYFKIFKVHKLLSLLRIIWPYNYFRGIKK